MELTEKEIQLLDSLYKRWERAIPYSHAAVLKRLFGMVSLKYTRPADLRIIGLEFLKRKFVGKGKLSPTVWDLFFKIARIVGTSNAREFRILMPSGAIVIVHRRGEVKDIALSVLRGRKSWTYKRLKDSEAKGRKAIEGSLGKVFTEMFVEKPTKQGRFSKEEYGGVDLAALAAYATPGGRDIVVGISHRLCTQLGNCTYNPKTKKVYRVDVE